MLKKQKVKAMYVTQVVCEECGEEMRCTHVLGSHPAQYCYKCSTCGATDCSTTKSGTIEYEFEEAECDV